MYTRYAVSQLKQNSYFLIGVIAGLYVALVCVPYDDTTPTCVKPSEGVITDSVEDPPSIENEPRPEPEAAPSRPIQRPRYYSTELGIRDKLFVAVLNSGSAITPHVTALNSSVAGVLQALKFFMTASTLESDQRLSNVVGFTDTREMLKPFHVLKYVADNYLEEYDFFFLLSDKGFLNARRLVELVDGISVSEDVYMGTPAEGDSHYCSLDKGILLSNSVLRLIHSSLDWCVRNSYSAQHHENLGRCVLHSTQLKCTQTVQGQLYKSITVEETPEGGIEEDLTEDLADAVTAFPVSHPDTIWQLHAHVSKILLERIHEEVWKIRRELVELLPHHPEGFRNATWPGGLRSDAGLAPPLPETRFDHWRWTWFNETHAYMLDDQHAVSLLPKAYSESVQLVMESVWIWSKVKWPDLSPSGLVEGLWRWEPARGLYYRLLLRFNAQDQQVLRQVEVCRPLGAAQLVSAPYVTESARISMVLPLLLTAPDISEHLAFLQRYETVCLQQDRKTTLTIVLIYHSGVNESMAIPIKKAAASLTQKYREASVEVIAYTPPLDTEPPLRLLLRHREDYIWLAIRWAMARLSKDALVLTADYNMEFNEEFLNRVRMNTIEGWQWFSPMPFARFAQYAHPMFKDDKGNKPQTNTGHFDDTNTRIVAFYRRDYDTAMSPISPSQPLGAADALASDASNLHCIRAPEPGLVLRPPPEPCPAEGVSPVEVLHCLQYLRDKDFKMLNLGNKNALAKMFLEMEIL